MTNSYEDIAKLTLAARDAIVEKDYNEAYHNIYLLAEIFSSDPFNPWKEFEDIAALDFIRSKDMPVEFLGKPITRYAAHLIRTLRNELEETKAKLSMVTKRAEDGLVEKSMRINELLKQLSEKS